MSASTFSGPIKAGTMREGSAANVGNVVLSQTATVAHTDTTAKNLFILPANSQIVDILIDVTTAFTDTGTDLLDIGITGTAAKYWNDAVVSALGRVAYSSGTPALSEWATVGTSDVQVTATFIGQNANADAGAARITILYVQK